MSTDASGAYPTNNFALVALSLGAGVQSTTLALLAVEGVLPKPDVEIFADTGWEQQAVYDHLDRRELRDQHPDEWADAVAFDEAIRKGGSRGMPLNGEAFLHRSRVPLALALIDRVTRHEWNGRQDDIFDALAETGDPDGCSPYGCRSGEAV